MRVPRWLQPPVFPDPESTRVGAVLHWMLLSLLGIVSLLALTVFSAHVARHRAPVWSCEIAVVGVVALAFVLLRTGRVHLAGAIFSLGLWLVVTAATFVFGGIMSPTIATYVTVGVVAGYFWGNRGLTGFSILTLVAGLGMVWAAYTNRIPVPLSPITPVNAWITLALALTVTAVLVNLSQRSTNAALAEAARSERAHRESEERYRSLVEQSPDALFLHDEQGILFANQALATLLRAGGPEVLVGRDPLELLGAADDRERRGRTQSLLTREGPGRIAEDVWTRLDGSRVPVEVTTRALRYGGRPAIQVLARDVSERTALEAELRQAQKMEAVGRLAGGIAHDFNNLLTAISGNAAFLIDALPQGSAELADALDVHRACERAAGLVQQLLAFSRKQVIHPQVLDPNAVVRDMERMLRRLIGENRNLKTSLDPDAGCVRADPVQMEQVLLNLAVNARDSMPRGGQIEITTRRVPASDGDVDGEGEQVLLAVSDTGEGMDAETRAHIFEPFFTTKDRFRGTGLGLSTVYGIVKQNGGSISVESAPGLGSTFRILLPRCSAAPAASEPCNRAEARGDETVLVAEDEPAVRRFVTRLLAAAGYRVLEAGDGAEALALAEQTSGPIHLLVTDVVMPELGGGELASRIKDTHPETRVLYLSGYPDDQIGQLGVLSADAAFLAKPFHAHELRERVRAILDAASAPAITPRAED